MLTEDKAVSPGGQPATVYGQDPWRPSRGEPMELSLGSCTPGEGYPMHFEDSSQGLS